LQTIGHLSEDRAMNSDERRLVDDLIRRLSEAPRGPRDTDAEAMIAEAVRRIPDAPYLLAQSLILHEQALAASVRRISELEREAAGERNSAQGGFLSGAPLGPWGTRQAPPTSGGYQQPQYPNAQYPQTAYQPPQAQPGAFGQGGGFLRGAAATALGFAGGTLLLDGLMGMLGHHGSMLGGFGGVTGAPTEINETVNNYYGGTPDGHNVADDRYANDPEPAEPAFQDASYEQDDGGWADDSSGIDDV
jgi:hypothetical protein